MSCCWICTACKDNEFVQDEFTCKACELGWWPDKELAGKAHNTGSREQHKLHTMNFKTVLLFIIPADPQFFIMETLIGLIQLFYSVFH